MCVGREILRYVTVIKRKRNLNYIVLTLYIEHYLKIHKFSLKTKIKVSTSINGIETFKRMITKILSHTLYVKILSDMYFLYKVLYNLNILQDINTYTVQIIKLFSI